MATKKYQPRTKEELRELCKKPLVHLGDIDTSLITDMSHLFWKTRRGEGDFAGIETWQVEQVVDMSWMFYRTCFNHPIGNWNVSNVKNFSRMFSGSNFNQPIEKWNVSSAEKMDGMFQSCPFNQPIDGWNVSNAKDLSYMFYGSKFNQDIGLWNVSNIEDASYMFFESSFKCSLNNWEAKQLRIANNFFGNEDRSVTIKLEKALDELNLSEQYEIVFNPKQGEYNLVDNQNNVRAYIENCFVIAYEYEKAITDSLSMIKDGYVL